MTVGQSLIDWLYTFGNIEINPAIIIETDQLDSGVNSFGLYKQPTKNITPYINGSADVEEYYYLMIRQSSKTNIARVDNQEWFEDFERWVWLMNIDGERPQLDGDRDCYHVGISSSGYMVATETDTAAYQVSIRIRYTEGING